MSQPAASMRVLHVDDEPDFADLAAEFIEREDERFTVDTATSADEAIEVLADADIDCIVSDYDMPGRNGIEFLHAVRDVDPDLPFILFTGKGSEEIASEAISAGVTDYLQKEAGTDQYTVLANRIRNAIDARRSAADAERRRHRLEQILKTVPACVVQIDYDGQFVFANDRAKEVLGLERDAVTDRTYNDPEWDIRDLDGHPIPDEELPFRQVRDTGEPGYGFRHSIEWPDGTRKVLLVNGAPLFDEAGNVESTVFALTDITERRERIEKLDQIKRNVSEVIWISTPDKDAMEFVSDAYEDVWGRSTESLKTDPTSFLDAIHPDDRDRVENALEAQAAAPDDYDEVYRVVRPDGEVRWVHDRSTGVYEQGELTRIVGVASDITERKVHEQKRKRIIDRVTDAMVEVNADWRITLVNEQAEALYDMSEDYLLGRDFREVFPEAVDTRFEEAYRSVMSTREPTSLVEHFPRLDGWFDVDVYPNEDGGISFYFRDVTDRIERTRELERIRDFFTEAERLGNLGAWEFTADGNVVWTDGTRRIHEVDDSFEPTMATGLDFIQPDDRDALRSAVDRALTDGEPYDIEARLHTDNGNERWVRTVGAPVEDEPGTVRGYIQDITDQKERERALSQAKAQLEAAIDAGAIATWEWHVQEDRLTAGTAFAETFGVDPDAAREGVSIDRFLPSVNDDDRDLVESKIQAALDECGEYEAEYRVRTADDELQWVVARGHVDCDADGTPRRFPGVIIDITDRKRAEEALERQNERLDRFASLVSHDLRSPLSVAEGRLELARADHDNEHLEAVSRSHERMNALIDDLLALSRQDEAIREEAPIDLAALVETCWANVVTDEASIDVAVTDRIVGDERRLKQLFENLFRNAVEHAGPTVTVTVSPLEDGFAVADDGPGIDPDDRDQVFESGYSTNANGTGYGLKIVEEIADAHGWTVQVTESDAGGARFEFTGVDRAE